MLKTLTFGQANRMLEHGTASLDGADGLRTPSGRYSLNETTWRYERDVPPDERRPAPPPVGPASVVTVLRRLGTMLQILGGVGLILAVCWWANTYYVPPLGAEPSFMISGGTCLYTKTVACLGVDILLTLGDRAPYDPLVFWVAGAMMLGGRVLRWCTRPSRRERLEGKA